MQQPSIDGLLLAGGFVGYSLLLGVLVRKRLWRTFPFFSAYIAFSVLSDLIAYWVLHHGSQRAYFEEYVVATLLDYTLQLLVLLEIALNVLRPVKRSLPKTSLIVLAGICFVVVPITLLLAPHAAYSGDKLLSLFFRVGLGFAVARLLIFLVVAGFAQMLGITWRNHVLQLSTGLAFYSAVAILVQLQISHLRSTTVSSDWPLLTELQSAAYLATIGFWTWAFSQNEAPRKEFTPQMEAVLVTIAGTAKRTRVAVTRSLGQR